METRRKVYILLILSIVWATIIFVGCTMPSKAIPKLSIPYIDKVAHFVFFFVQSILLSLLFYFKTRRRYFQIILFCTLVAFVYGGVIEILQNNFFDRTGDIYDLIADALGGLSGAICYPAFLRISVKLRMSRRRRN